MNIKPTAKFHVQFQSNNPSAGSGWATYGESKPSLNEAEDLAAAFLNTRESGKLRYRHIYDVRIAEVRVHRFYQRQEPPKAE